MGKGTKDLDTKKVKTALDDLPWGEEKEVDNKHIMGKQPLPEGVTKKMVYNDIIKIAGPSFEELMLSQLTSMVDLMMVGKLSA